MMGGGDIDLQRLAVAYANYLGLVLNLTPLSLALVKPGIVGMEAFNVEILIVCHGGGDTPGDVPVMAEVGQPWNAWERQPDSIELRTGQVILIEHVRGVERPMGVASEQRGPADGAPA